MIFRLLATGAAICILLVIVPPSGAYEEAEILEMPTIPGVFLTPQVEMFIKYADSTSILHDGPKIPGSGAMLYSQDIVSGPQLLPEEREALRWWFCDPQSIEWVPDVETSGPFIGVSWWNGNTFLGLSLYPSSCACIYGSGEGGKGHPLVHGRFREVPGEIEAIFARWQELMDSEEKAQAISLNAKEEAFRSPGPRITHALTAPSAVESFYLNPYSGNQGFERGDEYTVILGWLGGDGSRGKYGILGKGADLSSEQMQQIADLLLPRSNYRISSGPDDVKLCEFMPRHGLRFTTSEADTVDALVCFTCAQLSLRTMDGKEHWGGDFDPMEYRLKRLFDEFLPPRGKAR